jgi:hypothetical protein
MYGCSPRGDNKIPRQFQQLKNLTTYSANAKPGKTLLFEKDAVYGDSKEALIGNMGDMAVDNLGRVFIADLQKMVIDVFEPGGRFIAQLGREGKGPSEFSYIKDLQIRKDRLYVYDPNQQKVSVFTLNTLAGDKSIFLARNRGKYQALHRAYPWIHKIYVRNNSTYLAEFISDSSKPNKKWHNFETKGLFYLLDNTGKIVSKKLIDFIDATRTQFAWPNSEALLGLQLKPFFGNALTVLSSDNSIYWAGPDYLLIKIYSPDGAYQHAFYYPHKKIPLTQESAIEAGVRDLYIRNMKSMDLPRTWPVLKDMKIDDQDRLWIATTVKDMHVYEWWVLENTGELLTKFTWPRKEPIEEIKNGYMYTRETEEETGLQQIVRYRFEMD